MKEKLDWKEIEKIIYRTGKSWTPEEQMSYEEYLAREIELYIQQELDRAREEGRKELLDSIIEGVTQLKDLVSMFNPMSPEIRAKQSGEIEAYNGLLEKLSKLTTK